MATNKSKQKNNYGYSTPPPTQATINLQKMVDKPVDYATPIRNQYSRAEQVFNRSFKNPLGAHTTADVRDKSIRANQLSQLQNLGMDLSEAAQMSSQNQFGRQATVAGLTSPVHYIKSQSQPFTGGDVASMAVNGVMGL